MKNTCVSTLNALLYSFFWYFAIIVGQLCVKYKKVEMRLRYMVIIYSKESKENKQNNSRYSTKWKVKEGSNRQNIHNIDNNEHAEKTMILILQWDTKGNESLEIALCCPSKIMLMNVLF